jgi:exocyst complex component 4
MSFVVPASESTITTLYSLARHFSDISELCVLVLHLEVRMHCFHHLLAIAHGQNTDYHGVIDKMEPDENVTRLNKDLAAIEEAMQQSVMFRKFR